MREDFKHKLSSPILPTTFIQSPALATRFNLKSLTFATETFQVTGSFKFRAAFNLASSIDNQLIIAASSGNFGQALACACSMLGKRSIIVMPQTSARVKIEAVQRYGGIADLIDTALVTREGRVAEIASENPDAYVASAYDDDYVIAGNATLGRELAAATAPRFEVIIAPVGGGGLTSGLITGIASSECDIPVYAAEPLIANDAAQSMRVGHIVINESEPPSIADGARTRSLGQRNWAILRNGLNGIIEVSEDKIAQAVLELFTLANLKAEPTGALSFGALLTAPDQFEGKHVCCVISGGNVDPAVYAGLIQNL